MRKKVSVKPPKGFVAIGTLAKSWEFRKHPILTGTIQSFGEVMSKFKRGEKQRNAIIQSDELGSVTVWESAGTRPLFSLAEGTRVCVLYEGEQKIKGRKLPMHAFQVLVAEDDYNHETDLHSYEYKPPKKRAAKKAATKKKKKTTAKKTRSRKR